MRSMYLAALSIAFACLVKLISSNDSFTCGSGEAQTSLSSAAIRFTCRKRYDHFNFCCSEHDRCYRNQYGREECDDMFCGCVEEAAQRSVFCKFGSKTFCAAVRTLGGIPYDRAAARMRDEPNWQEKLEPEVPYPGPI